MAETIVGENVVGLISHSILSPMETVWSPEVDQVEHVVVQVNNIAAHVSNCVGNHGVTLQDVEPESMSE